MCALELNLVFTQGQACCCLGTSVKMSDQLMQILFLIVGDRTVSWCRGGAGVGEERLCPGGDFAVA